MRQIALVQELGPALTFISGRVDVDYSALGCRVLHDREAGLGPLGGIERALHACDADLLLVLAVDLAAMTSGFLRRLTARCDWRTGFAAGRPPKMIEVTVFTIRSGALPAF